MIKSVLFGPVYLSFIVLNSAPVSEETVEKVALVAAEEPVPQIFVEADQLQTLRDHLKKLGESFEKMQQAVEAVSQQRDEARAEAKRGQEQLRQAMKELEELQKQLASARADAERWKDKARTAQLTQEDLQKFRGELKGAITDFQHLKGDFAQARSELRDPLERAEMKKAMAEVEKEHQQLKKEIELALQSRAASVAETKKLQQKWQRAVKQSERLKGELAQSRQEVVSLKQRLSETMAVNEGAMDKLHTIRERLGELDAVVERLKQDKEAAAKNMAALRQQGVMTEAMKAEMVAQKAKLEEATRKLSKVEEVSATWKARSDELRGKLAKAERELAEMRAELEKQRAQMAAAPEADKALVAELAHTKAELTRVQNELSFLHKSKGGLEELLFKKTAEIRELKGQLRRAEGKNKPKDGEKQTEVEKSKALSSQVIPRAVVVYEG